MFITNITAVMDGGKKPPNGLGVHVANVLRSSRIYLPKYQYMYDLILPPQNK